MYPSLERSLKILLFVSFIFSRPLQYCPSYAQKEKNILAKIVSQGVFKCKASYGHDAFCSQEPSSLIGVKSVS